MNALPAASKTGTVGRAIGRSTGVPDKIKAARLAVCVEKPYFAGALYALKFVPVLGMGTLAVDKFWRCYYDPAATEVWSLEALKTVLEHEISHLLREHCYRREERGADPQAWNIAGDAEINDNLYGREFPFEPVTPKNRGWEDGKLAEEYYAAIPESEKGRDGGEPKDGDGEGDGKSGGGGKPQPGSGKCGSGAGGEPGPWELGDPSEEAPGVTKGEGDMIAQDTARRIIEHASQTRGSVPGGWVRWAQKKLKPRVNPWEILAGAVRKVWIDLIGAQDYSFQRMHRRQAVSKVILPTLVDPLPNAAMVIDTSGSMSDTEVSTGIGVIARVLRALGGLQRTTVFAVDAQVHAVRKVIHERQIVLGGGGGTNMIVGIEAALALRPRPDLIVVVTDGGTAWPEEKPRGSRIVGVFVGPYGAEGAKRAPEWMRKVVIDPADVQEAA